MKKKIFLLLTAAAGMACAQTRILDTMRYPSGNLVNGTLRISWQAWTIGGTSYPAGQLQYQVVAGVVDLTLQPNPTGKPYIVTYSLENGRPVVVAWNVPTSTSPVTVSAIQSEATPATTIDYTIDPGRLMQRGATVNQALCWDGTSWSPGACGGGGGGGGEVVVPGYGITKVGTTVSIDPSITLSYSYNSGDPLTGSSCAVGKLYFRGADASLWYGTPANTCSRLTSQSELTTALATKQNSLAAGTTSTYLRGDFTQQPLATAVRAQMAAGLGIAYDSATGTITWSPSPGIGLICVGAACSVDSDIVAYHYEGAGAPTGSCVTGRATYTDTTNHNLYFCSGSTWRGPFAVTQRTITTTYPLQGGGDLTANRNLTLNMWGTGDRPVAADGLGMADNCAKWTASGIADAGAPCGSGGGGSGDVTGPASATDYSIANFNGTTGKILRASGVTTNASGDLTSPGQVTTGDGTVSGGFTLNPAGDTAHGIGFKAPASRTSALKLELPSADLPGSGVRFMGFSPPSSGTATSNWYALYAPGVTIASADLPNPGASAGGKVQSKTCASGDYVSAINTDSTVTCGTPAGGGGSTTGLYSGTINFGLLPDGGCADGSITASGLNTGKTLALSMPAGIETGLVGMAISSSNSATIRLCNFSGAAVDPASGTFAVRDMNSLGYLTASAAINFAAIPDGSCATNTITLTGAASGDNVAAGYPPALEAGLVGMMYVSAANTVTIRLCNWSGASVDPASGSYIAAITR